MSEFTSGLPAGTALSPVCMQLHNVAHAHRYRVRYVLRTYCVPQTIHAVRWSAQLITHAQYSVSNQLSRLRTLVWGVAALLRSVVVLFSMCFYLRGYNMAPDRDLGPRRTVVAIDLPYLKSFNGTV